MSIHDINSMVDYLKANWRDDDAAGGTIHAVCREVENLWSGLADIRAALEMPDATMPEMCDAIVALRAENRLAKVPS